MDATSTQSPDNEIKQTSPGSSAWNADADLSVKRKKAKTPLSIEDVFNKVSVLTSSNINPPPSRVVLTPRSADVCLKLGINPEILKIRDIDSFWEAGIDPSVQRMRHEAYVQRRYELMKQCRLERKRLINAEFNKSADVSAPVTKTVGKSSAELEAAETAIIEQEKARLEKLKRRQEKELEQMLQYEINRVKIQSDIEKRIEQNRKQESLRQKQQEKRAKLMAEERRLRELQKIAMAEAEEAHAKEVAKQIFEREKAAAEEQARRVQEQKEAMRREEDERKQKHEEHKLQVQKFFAEQELELQKRLDEMDIAAKKREEDILRKREEELEKLARKRAAVEERIERNIQMAEEVEKRRKEEFLRSQKEFEDKRQKHLDQLEYERRLKAQELELQEQRRKMIIMQQKREEEKRKEQLLSQFEEEEEHVEEVIYTRKKEVEVMKERKTLRMQMKAENVNRVKRINDYEAMKTLKKIEDNEKRTEQLYEQKRSLIEQRKRAAAEARLQKEQMLRAMESLKNDPAQADKVIQKALAGKLSASDIVSGKLGRTNKKSTKSKSTSELLGVKRTSNSAGTGEQQSEIDLNNQINSQSVRGRGNRDAMSAPMAYKSPYDSTYVTEEDESL